MISNLKCADFFIVHWTIPKFTTTGPILPQVSAAREEARALEDALVGAERDAAEAALRASDGRQAVAAAAAAKDAAR